MPGFTAESISSLPDFSSVGLPAGPAMTPCPTRSYDACASRVQADARMSAARPRPTVEGVLFSPESGSASLNHPTTSTPD